MMQSASLSPTRGIPLHTLDSGDWRAIVCPALGGAIARLSWRECDVLRPALDSDIAAANVRRMGCYPLAPYSNRIGDGRFVFGGKAYRVNPNFPPEPHAIHGFAWQQAWRVITATQRELAMALDHEPDGDWPFACRIEQIVTLTPSGLTLQLRLTNSDARPAPGGLGWHPYFPLTKETRLQTGWSRVWLMEDDKLPKEIIGVPPVWNFSTPRALAGMALDNCFTEWNGCARIRQRDHLVVLNAASALSAAVLFVPGDGRDFMAFEPVSHSNNALQHRTGRPGVLPMRELAPGETWTAAMSLQAEAT